MLEGEDVGLAEGGGRFTPGLGDLVGQLLGPGDDANTATAAAEAGFDDDRVSDALADRAEVVAVPQRLLDARHGGHPDRLGEPAGRRLVAEDLELAGGGTDEADALGFARQRQPHVLGQEPVARVDGVRAAPLRDGDDLIDVEIRAYRFTTLCRTDRVRFVGLEAVGGKPVFVAVDGYGSQPQLGGRAKTANRDL